MADVSFLSARVDPETKRRLKALAAREGRTVQDIVRAAVTDYVDRAAAPAPDLASVLGRLRIERDLLRCSGVTRLRVFGSVARGEARPDSDIDLAVEFAGTPSLVALARLRSELEERLARRVDLVPWSALDPAMRAAVEWDGVDVPA